MRASHLAGPLPAIDLIGHADFASPDAKLFPALTLRALGLLRQFERADDER